MAGRFSIHVRGVSVLLAAVLLAAFLSVSNARLRPVLTAMAEERVENAVTTAIHSAVADLWAGEALEYGDLVTLHTDEEGRVTALSFDAQQANLLRAALLAAAQDAVEAVKAQDLSIPLGSLTKLDLLYGRGPTVTVRVLSVGTVSAEYGHSFTEAGINQTLHQIVLHVTVTVRFLLPGQRPERTVSVPICVAETVIVGQVPETYVQTEQ